ncbi:MAG: hypothetical protein IJY08_02625 [Clostridia bacterium]|nr:hypothetical protein [Clostridia bacterium]
MSDNKILFFADARAMSDCMDSDKTVSDIGFRKMGVSEGAPSEGDPVFSVENGRLHIVNHFADRESADTFFEIPALSAQKMCQVGRNGYTLQYDVTCVMPQKDNYQANTVFITDCSDDCGCYVELPVKMRGRANHAVCVGNCNMSLTKAGIYAPNMHGRAEGQPALVQKLLGEENYDPWNANAPYLRDKKVAVRVYHEPCGRETVYMLVPRGFGGRDEWTLVSRTVRDSVGDPYRHLGLGGDSIRFKVTAGANSYIESMCVWSGLDDIPSECDPGYPPLSLERPDEECGGEWLLEELPPYTHGRVCGEIFEASVGYWRLSAGDSRMALVSETDADAFGKYAATLRKHGYELRTVRDDGTMTAYRISKGAMRAYMYFAAARGEARFIIESEQNTLPEDFSYTYAKGAGDSTALYLYGLHMDPDGLNLKDNNNTASNCGMFLILKLADDSVMIIDGGGHPQMDKAAGEELNRFLHEITHTPMGGRVTVRNWFITHDHGDHFNGFTRFLLNYHEQYLIERMMFHFCATHLPPNIKRLINEHLKVYYPDIRYYKPHTGERIRLADVDIEVLYTLEDEIDARTGGYVSDDFNDTSTCLRLRFDGKTALILGDIYYYAAGVLMLNQTPEALKSDIVQIAHHGLNDLGVLYSYANADIAFYPQSSTGALRINNGHGSTVYKNIVRNVTNGKDSLCFAGDGTYGAECVDGEVKVVYRRAVSGGLYSGWDTFDLFEGDTP